MSETARTLADDILKAAGSSLRHYEAASQERIVAVAQRWLDKAGGGWQPIETAPRDGRLIDAYDVNTRRRGIVAFNSQSEWESVHAGTGLWLGIGFYPTHWKVAVPLPTISQHGEEA